MSGGKVHGQGGHGGWAKREHRDLAHAEVKAVQLQRQHTAFVGKVKRCSERAFEKWSEFFWAKAERACEMAIQDKIPRAELGLRILALQSFFEERVKDRLIVGANGELRKPTEKEMDLFSHIGLNRVETPAGERLINLSKQALIGALKGRGLRYSDAEIAEKVAKWKRRINDKRYW